VAESSAAEALAAQLLRDPRQFDQVARELAGANHSIDIPISGGSMGAALPNGSVARILLADGATCTRGDVVVFRLDDQLVAHRVVYIRAPHLVTRGDARIAPDPPIPFARVLGRMIEPPALIARSRRARIADVFAIGVTVAALRVSPSLAERWTRLLRWAERKRRPASRRTP